MDENMRISDSMSMTFECRATIMFSEFSADDCATLSIYIISGFIISILLELLLKLKEYLIKKYSKDSNPNYSIDKKAYLVLVYSGIIFLSALHMFFLMGCNFWIVLSIIIGNLIGYIIFGLNDKINKLIVDDKEKLIN